jgi:hypothetical protein
VANILQNKQHSVHSLEAQNRDNATKEGDKCLPCPSSRQYPMHIPGGHSEGGHQYDAKEIIKLKLSHLYDGR